MYYCPHCNSHIYNRKLTFCSTCFEPLPDDIRMSEEQIELLEAEKAESIQKAKRHSLSKYNDYDF